MTVRTVKSRVPADDTFVNGEVISRKCRKCRTDYYIGHYRVCTQSKGARERVCRTCKSALAYAQYRTDPRYHARVIFEQRKNYAKRYNIPFTITIEWFLERITNGVCDATGLPFDLSCDHRAKYSPSIDQINPRQGYTLENVQIVVLIYNMAKNIWSEADVIMMAEALLATHEMKKNK